MDAEQLLKHARSALARTVPGLDPATVVLAGNGQQRRRSDVLFLGLSDEAPARRWVLKVPHSHSRQHDLAPPLDARRQVQALERLCAHLSVSSERLFAPRVVAHLPDVDGYLMEYVAGTPLTATFRARALLDDTEVLHGARLAAEVLRAVHSIQPVDVVPQDLTELHTTSARQALGVLTRAGLPTRPAWLGDGHVPSAATPGRKVLLHGDFAPENVVLAARGTCCLDPDLVERDWAERDVARFVQMLSEAPLFVSLTDLPAAHRLRRRATTAFLEAYYGDRGPDPSLRVLLLPLLAARWATRDGDVVARRPRLAGLRRLLLRRHFTRLLDEVASPGWPDQAT